MINNMATFDEKSGLIILSEEDRKMFRRMAPDTKPLLPNLIAALDDYFIGWEIKPLSDKRK